MIESVLVADRGQLARRIIRTAQRMGLRAVAVHSEPDVGLPFVREADEAMLIGPADPARSYGDADAVLEAARTASAQAVHPGCGELAADADFARRVQDAGLVWVGPPAQALERARDPVSVHEAARHAGSATSKVLDARPGLRRITVQILGLADGRVVALGVRDPTVRQRTRSVVVECPSPWVGQELRERLERAAVRLAEALGYRNAGAVECQVDLDAGVFGVLGVQPRLSLDHLVTELTYGVDLVEQQLLIAAGRVGSCDADPPSPRGHALQLHVSTDDPRLVTRTAVRVTRWTEPVGDGVRVESGYEGGTTLTGFSDRLLATLAVHGRCRPEALERARDAVAGFTVEGLETDLPSSAALLSADEFVAGGAGTIDLPADRAHIP